MTRSEMKSRAKDSLKGNWGTAIGTMLVGMIILGAAGAAGVGVGEIILMGVIATGFCVIYLSMVRNEKVVFGKMFDGFNNFGSTCVAGILVWLYTTLWSMLFFIPGIVKTYSYAMTFYILCDHPEMSGNEAITKSKEMMSGHKWELFVLDLSFIGWALLAGLTFGLLLLYVSPYMAATKAEFYENLKAQCEPKTEPAAVNATV